MDIKNKIIFGTYKLVDKDILFNTLDYAYNYGYRYFDCAELYKNQHMIGEFFQKKNIKREDYYITSKLSFRTIPKGEIEIRKSIEKTLKDLNTTYIDIMLIHAPCKNDIMAWKILTEYKNNNIIRNIGISNYNIINLEQFLNSIDNIKDVYCNQIEFNPFLNRIDLINRCKENNINIMSYGSMYKSNDIVERIADKLNKTKEQILVKYGLIKGISVITTALCKDYMRMNIDMDFTIDNTDLDNMDNMNENFSNYKRFL